MRHHLAVARHSPWRRLARLASRHWFALALGVVAAGLIAAAAVIANTT